MTKGDKELEREASYFACMLLIPQKFLKEDMTEDFDLSDDNRIKELAKKYQVPLNAMLLRIQIYFNPHQ